MTDKTTINIIVAVADDWAIGREGDMPWHISADMKFFKATTMGHSLVMGRRTWVFLCHVLAARLHQFHLDRILYLLYRHLTVTTLGDMVSDLVQQALILTFVGMEHCLTNCRHDFLFIETHNAAISFYYCLDHIVFKSS